ncbi:MAG: ABC transporter permease [Bacteroidia bacterium]
MANLTRNFSAPSQRNPAYPSNNLKPMRNLFLVALYEARMRLRQTGFWAGTVLMCVMMGLIAAIPIIENLPEKKRSLWIWVHGTPLPPDTENFTFHPAPSSAPVKEMLSDTVVFLVLPGDWTKKELSFTFHVGHPLPPRTEKKLKKYLEDFTYKQRLTQLQMDEKTLQSLTKLPSITFYTLKGPHTPKTSSSPEQAQFISILFLIFLNIHGAFILQSVLEEKTHRLAEYLLTVLGPHQILMGKVLGILAVAFFQVLLWGIFLVGIDEAVKLSGFLPPEIISKASPLSLLNLLAGQPSWTWVILFLLGGTWVYAFFYAAAGAASQSPTELSSMAQIIFFLPAMAFVFAQTFFSRPNHPLMIFFSYFPLTSPICMAIRASEGVPLWEKLLSLTLLGGFGFFSAWMGGKIYREGLLTQQKLSWKKIAQILTS